MQKPLARGVHCDAGWMNTHDDRADGGVELRARIGFANNRARPQNRSPEWNSFDYPRTDQAVLTETQNEAHVLHLIYRCVLPHSRRVLRRLMAYATDRTMSSQRGFSYPTCLG